MIAKLSDWRVQHMILWGVDCSRWHELPHGHSWVTDDRNQLIRLAGSRICSRDCRWRCHKGRLRVVHRVYLLLEFLLFHPQPLLLITEFVFLSLHKSSKSSMKTQDMSCWIPETKGGNFDPLTRNLKELGWVSSVLRVMFHLSPRSK